MGFCVKKRDLNLYPSISNSTLLMFFNNHWNQFAHELIIKWCQSRRVGKPLLPVNHSDSATVELMSKKPYKLIRKDWMCTIVDMHDGYGDGNNHAKQNKSLCYSIPHNPPLIAPNGYYSLYTNKHQRDPINLIRGSWKIFSMHGPSIIAERGKKMHTHDTRVL